MRTVTKLFLVIGLCATLIIGGVGYASASNKPIGSWAFPDLGQGGHGGGPLYADGSMGGGGHVSLNNGQIEAKLLSGHWEYAPGSTADHPLVNVQLFVEGFANPFQFTDLRANVGPYTIQQHGFTIRIVLWIR